MFYYSSSHCDTKPTFITTRPEYLWFCGGTVWLLVHDRLKCFIVTAVTMKLRLPLLLAVLSTFGFVVAQFNYEYDTYYNNNNDNSDNNKDDSNFCKNSIYIFLFLNLNHFLISPHVLYCYGYQGRIQNDFWVGFDLIILPYLLYVIGKTGISKLYRPSSDATERGFWSGSTLFTTSLTILHTFIGSKMDLLRRRIR